MADLKQLEAAFLRADAAGDVEAATVLAKEVRRMRAGKPAQEAAPNPTEGMSATERFTAGYGKAAADLGRGVSQRIRALGPQYNASADFFGLPNQADVDEAKRLDAPLMATTGGMFGNITGNVANAIPTVAFGGGLPAAAMTGGGMGFVQPTAGDESVLQNTLVGAGAGAAGNLLGRGIGAAYHGVKALAEPFSQRGREQIAGRMIQRFADRPGSVAGTTSAPTITGARPTLAEQTGDVGLARLQDSLRAADPQFNNQITARLAENNAARVNALQNLTGQGGARDFAAAHRGSTAAQQYERAFSVPVKTEDLSPAMKGEVTKLMQMPAIQDALKVAKENAANFGMKAETEGSIAGLHQAKLAMDDAISKLTGGGAVEANKAAGIRAARDRLVTFMEKMSPDYQEARVTYAQMSKPLNAMDVAAEVAKRGLSKGSDLSGNQTINRNALLGALQDEGALIKKATGRNAGKALEDVFEPADLNMLRAIASEADRAGAVATAGNGPGSATAQRMASQNVLRQIIGPTGLPESWAENALANTIVGKPLNLIYGGVAEPRIQQELARAILDPTAAQRVIQAARMQGIQLPPSVMQQLLASAARAVPPAIAVGGQR